MSYAWKYGLIAFAVVLALGLGIWAWINKTRKGEGHVERPS